MLLKNKPLGQFIGLFYLLFSVPMMGQVQLGNDLVGQGANDRYGRETALSDDGRRVVSVGGNGPNGVHSGNLRIQEYNITSSTWGQVGNTIVGDAAGARLGFSADISGDGKRVVALSPSYIHNGYQAGLVRIFQENNGVWTQVGSDIIGQGQVYDYEVSISKDGQRVAIGTQNNIVKVFEETALGWLQVGSNLGGNGLFGHSVSLSRDGKRLAVGAPGNSSVATSAGQVRIFEENNGAWILVGAPINGAINIDQTGYDVALSDDGKRVVFSDYGYQVTMEKGRVRVFEEIGGVWSQVGTGIQGDNQYDNFGRTVDISGDGKRIIASSRSNTNGGNNAGHVKVYEETANAWSQLGTDINGAPNSRSGTASAISTDGHTVATGAPSYNSNLGRVRVFGIPVDPACIVEQEITNHYCKRRDYLFEPIAIIHNQEIVLEIDNQGILPSGACNSGPANWTHFKIKTESFPTSGSMTTPIAQVTLNNIPVSDLYNLAGSTASFYHLPSNGVATGGGNTNYRLRVTLTGVRGSMVSAHSTEYTLTTSTSFIYQCSSPSTNPGPGPSRQKTSNFNKTDEPNFDVIKIKRVPSKEPVPE